MAEFSTKRWHMMTERSGRVLFLAAGALTVNSTQAEFMQQNVHKQETYGIMKAKQSGFSYALHLYIFFLSPLISQCASWRRDLWGTVYDIRLRIDVNHPPSGNKEKKRGGRDKEIHGEPDRNGDGRGMNMTEREGDEKESEKG